MAMKKKLTAEEYEKLSDAMKAEYKKIGDGYSLDLSDDEDITGLKNALSSEKEERRKAKEKLTALEAEKDALQAKIDGTDDKALQKSYEKKIEKINNEHKELLNKKDSFIQRTLVDSVAQSIAAKISTSPALILPHIKARLSADLASDEPRTVVVDKEGKPSAFSIDDLEKEFIDNADFKSIIKASGASGGGAGRQSYGSGSAGDGKKTFAEMTGAERIAFQKADPEGFTKAAAVQSTIGFPKMDMYNATPVKSGFTNTGSRK
jgi:hypothetical protein